MTSAGYDYKDATDQRSMPLKITFSFVKCNQGQKNSVISVITNFRNIIVVEIDMKNYMFMLRIFSTMDVRFKCKFHKHYLNGVERLEGKVKFSRHDK